MSTSGLKGGRVKLTRPPMPSDQPPYAIPERKRTLESKKGKTGKDVTYLPPGEGTRSLRVMGEFVAYKIASCKTGGAYSLFEVETPPGSGVPPHVQHREDEAFFVLEGEYEFLVEGRRINAGAGSLIYVPKGTLHAHNSVHEGLGRMLVTQTPGGLYEHFFEEVGKPVDEETGPLAFENHPKVRRMVEAAAKYGIEIPPPIT